MRDRTDSVAINNPRLTPEATERIYIALDNVGLDDDIKIRLSKHTLLKALIKYEGNVSAASSSVSINRNQHALWLKKDAGYAEAWDIITESWLDDVEAALKRQIDAGDTRAIIYALNSKGQKRGWGEKAKIEITGGPDSIPLERLPDSELLRIAEEEAKRINNV